MAYMSGIMAYMWGSRRVRPLDLGIFLQRTPRNSLRGNILYQYYPHQRELIHRWLWISLIFAIPTKAHI